MREIELYCGSFVWPKQLLNRCEIILSPYLNNIEKNTMRTKQETSALVYQNYREFVQYLNDLYSPPLFYMASVYLPFITIFGDMLTLLNPYNFLRSLSSMSASEIILSIGLEVPTFLLVFKIVILLSLFMPVFIVIIIAILTLGAMKEPDIEIGYFHKYYTGSGICNAIRYYISMFQRVLFPIFISFAIKIAVTTGPNSDQLLGILILILALANSIAGHYYRLEIPCTKSPEYQTRQINFPNPIIECIFLFLIIVLINSTTGIAPYAITVCLLFLMIFITRFLKYENSYYYPHYFFCLLCANSFALGFFISYFNSEPVIMILGAIIKILFLTKIKKNLIQGNKAYTLLQSRETIAINLENAKENLRNQRIAIAFRQAVFLSRKKSSHRIELIVDIIKSKCYYLESESRGSTKTADSNLLLKYEMELITIINKIIEVQHKAVQVLSIMNSKEPKNQLFIKNVVELVDLIDENKRNFIECIKINALAEDLNILMKFFFSFLFNDGIFLRKIRSEYRDEINDIKYNRIQKQLFSKETALIVINISDQIGKITKVSNNIPNILGYSSQALIGLSINGLIPFTIREIHDEIIKNFISNFTSEVMRKKPTIQFYCYDKSFHLQKIQVRYKFFLHSFSNFELSSVVRKVKTEDFVILTDENGNIEGWTAQIGELYNFDELGPQCRAYNILPLIPAYAKYNQKENVNFKSLMFRLSKMKSPNLVLEEKESSSTEEIQKKQIKAFQKLLESGEIVEAFYVTIGVQIKFFERFKKSMKVIKITDLKPVENFEIIERLILNSGQTQGQEKPCNAFDFQPGLQGEKSIDESQDGDYSILKEKEEATNADFNFSLDFSQPPLFTFMDIKFSKDIDRFQSISSSRSLVKVNQTDENRSNFNENMSLQSNFDPKLERNNNFLWMVVLVTLIVLAIVIEDQISLSTIFQKLELNKIQILRSNRAEMIYCKSVFNINKTYISQFASGKLLINNNWLFQNNSTYVAYTGDLLTQNNYYLLNIQIPSTLERALYFKNAPNLALYTNEIKTNFYNVISLYESMYDNMQSSWGNQIESAKQKCALKMIAYSAGAVVYLLFLVFIWHGYKKQKKITEAFFKFEKVDINEKITQIQSITNVLIKRCKEWHIDEQLSELRKGKELKKKQSNIEGQSQIKRTNSKSNSDFNVTSKLNWGEEVDQYEESISSKRFYMIAGLIAFVLLSQVLFLILHGVLSSRMLDECKNVIQKFDDANKLTVYPNLKMASLFDPVPPAIVNLYEKKVKLTLDEPIYFMPKLLHLLSDKPCTNCTFLGDILNTNYRSFYSYFIQLMLSYDVPDDLLTNSSNAQMLQSFMELFFAVDVVINNISESLVTQSINNPRQVLIIYLLSVIIFFGSVVMMIKKLESEYSKLEFFLKFFHQEALLKNKHMSTVMAKNM